MGNMISSQKNMTFIYFKELKVGLIHFMALIMLITPAISDAEISGLTLCSSSEGFKKRKNNEIKALMKKIRKFDDNSAPTAAIKTIIDRINKRFRVYSDSGLLCGGDGLPHLISDPGMALKYGHAGDTLIPTLRFIYFSGFLGHSGRIYLEETRNSEHEIIIDVPLAFSALGRGLGWPLLVFTLIRTGNLTDSEENITVSPR